MGTCTADKASSTWTCATHAWADHPQNWFAALWVGSNYAFKGGRLQAHRLTRYCFKEACYIQHCTSKRSSLGLGPPWLRAWQPQGQQEDPAPQPCNRCRPPTAQPCVVQPMVRGQLHRHGQSLLLVTFACHALHQPYHLWLYYKYKRGKSRSRCSAGGWTLDSPLLLLLSAHGRVIQPTGLEATIIVVRLGHIDLLHAQLADLQPHDLVSYVPLRTRNRRPVCSLTCTTSAFAGTAHAAQHHSTNKHHQLACTWLSWEALGRTTPAH